MISNVIVKCSPQKILETIPTHFDLLLVRLRYVQLRVEAPPKIHHLGNLHVNVWLHVSCDCMLRKCDRNDDMPGLKKMSSAAGKSGWKDTTFWIRNVQLYILNLHFIKTNFLFPGSSSRDLVWTHSRDLFRAENVTSIRESNGHFEGSWLKKLQICLHYIFLLHSSVRHVTCSMIILPHLEKEFDVTTT